MSNTEYVIINMYRFISSYMTIKALHSCVMGTVMMALVVLIRHINKRRVRTVDYYSLLLLFPMLFTGMSKLFFTRYGVYVYMCSSKIAGTVLSLIYLSVMLLLLVIYVIRNRIHLSRIRRLEPMGPEYAILIGRAMDAVDLKHGFIKVDFYITDENVSPYSGGTIRPYIVMPAKEKTGVNDNEYYIMLCHELVHIREHHLIWLTVYDLACIWWWFNPFIYLFRELYRDDMELKCDETCILAADVSESDYAGTILRVLQNMKAGGQRRSVYFADKYLSTRRRITSIIENGSSGKITRRRFITGSLAVIVLLAALVCATSYPRYTNMTEITLQDVEIMDPEVKIDNSNLKTKMLEYDTPRLKEAVEVRNGELRIKDKELFGRILDEHGVTNDYVYIGFDGIMKIPGVGGGGNTGMVNTKDYDDIFYLAADTLDNDIMEFLLKII